MKIIRYSILTALSLLCSTEAVSAEIASFSSQKFAQRRPPFEQLFSENAPTKAGFPQFHSKIKDGITLLKQGELAKAKSTLQQALNGLLKKKNSISRGQEDELHYLQGLAYEGLGKDKEAESAFKKSLALRASNGPALLHLGVLLAQQKKCQEALSKLDEAKWRLPEFEYLVAFEVSECDRHEGRTQVANIGLQNTLKLNPAYLPALRRAAELRIAARSKVHDPEKRSRLENSIIRDLRSIVAADPNDHEAGSILAQMLIETSDPFLDSGSLAEAEILMSRIVQHNSFKNPNQVFALFEAQLKQKKLEEAKSTIQNGLANNPKHPKLQNASLQLEIEFGANLAEK